jgi:hypothetical protein
MVSPKRGPQKSPTTWAVGQIEHVSATIQDTAMADFKEGNLLFQFNDAHWTVLKYDEDNLFRKSSLPHATKAVDFAGIFQGNKLVLMEVKDFRQAPAASRERFKEDNPESLYEEIPQKARDTLACIIGFSKTSTNAHSAHAVYRDMAGLAGDPDRKVVVVFYLEEAPHTEAGHSVEQQNRAKRSLANKHPLAEGLKKKLQWLTSHVLVATHGHRRFMAENYHIAVQNQVV